MRVGEQECPGSPPEPGYAVKAILKLRVAVGVFHHMDRLLDTINGLTAEGFAPFGEVIEARGEPTVLINRGKCARYSDLAALDFAVEILENTDFAAGCGRIAIGRGFEEIDLARQIQLTHQIGNKDERATQQPHHDQLVCVAKVGRNFVRKGFDPRSDGFRRNHRLDSIVGVIHANPLGSQQRVRP